MCRIDAWRKASLRAGWLPGCQRLPEDSTCRKRRTALPILATEEDHALLLDERVRRRDGDANVRVAACLARKQRQSDGGRGQGTDVLGIVSDVRGRARGIGGGVKQL